MKKSDIEQRKAKPSSGSYSADELRLLWQIKRHEASERILQMLQAGELHVASLTPLRYSGVRPEAVQPLTGKWLAYAKLDSPQTFPQLWEEASRRGDKKQQLESAVIHLMALGYFAWVKSPAPGTISLPWPVPLNVQLEQMRQERLAAVQWPARLWQITAAWKPKWGLSSGAVNNYLYDQVGFGYLKVIDGVYYLPHQQAPDPLTVPRSTIKRKTKAKPTTKAPKPKPPTLTDQRLAQVSFPVTVRQAANAWGLDYYAAAQYLHRLKTRGVLKSAGEGEYDLA